MNRIKNRLREADRRIRECTARIGGYHQRIAARPKNPLAAQRAAQLLPVALQHLKQLTAYRRRLEHALRMEAHLSAHKHDLPLGRRDCLATCVDERQRNCQHVAIEC
jgi:hypothetical protein